MARLDLTTFGEGGLRLSVPAGQRIETAMSFDVEVSGTEANVAGALARLGWKCGWVSALPETPPGRRVLNACRNNGIDVSAVAMRAEGRVSCYYVEYAHPPRPVRIYYDRKDSCLARLNPDDVDWDYLLDTRHLHMSGLTVPLSGHTAAIVARALEQARRQGISTSFDVNYRKLLWPAAEAGERLLPLMAGVDVLFCGRRDAESLFGCQGEPEELAVELAERTGARNVVISLSSDGAVGWDGSDMHREDARRVRIVDRIGAGDAMVAGVLHGWMKGSLARGLRYGTTMAALALSQFGETVVTHESELDSLLDGDSADIVR